MSKGQMVFYVTVGGLAVYELFKSHSFFILFLVMYLYSLRRDLGERTPRNSRYRSFFGADRGDRDI